MVWQYPQLAWLLLLLPLLAAVGYAGYSWHRRKLNALAPNSREQWRLLGVKKITNPTWAIVRYMLAAACMVLALMNPQREKDRLAMPGEAVRLLMLVDVSNSMLANDIAPSRLENARTLALKVQDNLPGAQLGVLLFAGTAWLALPVTPDAMAVRQVLQTMSPDQMPQQGTDLGQALQVAGDAFGSVPLAPKAILLITDGEDLEKGIDPGLQAMRQLGVRVYTVGIGTPEGSTLTLPGSTEQLTDDYQEPVVSRLDEATLHQIAQETGGSYYAYTAGNEELITSLSANLKKVATQPVNDRRVIRYQSYAAWFVLSALGLLLWPGTQMLPRLRKKTSLTAASLLLLTTATTAQSSADTAVLLAKGNAAWKKQEIPEAMEYYSQVLKQHPNHYVSRFQTGLAMLQSKKYNEAAEQFANLGTVEKAAPIQGAALYNHGLALAQQGNFAEAIDALKKAQQLLPNHPDVLANLQKALLEKPQKSPPQQQQNKPGEKPPFDQEQASQKLQAIQEAEKKIRQQQKTKGDGKVPEKAW